MIKSLSGLLLAGVMLSSVAFAAPINPIGVAATGAFSGSIFSVGNGVIPAEGSVWNATTNVRWTGLTTSFTFDFGSEYVVSDLLLSLDNNDDYRVLYSLDDSSYNTLFNLNRTLGEMTRGMDTMSSDSAHPEYVAALDFAPVNARYLRLAATGGDSRYAVGELQAFGELAPVPETSVWLMMLSGLGLLGMMARRKMRQN